MNSPNIVLILMDQLALHAVSAYGAPMCQTPNIDALARDGVTFQRSYTPCALCTPARASLLSGVYPHKHGAIHNSETKHLPFGEDELGRRLTMYPQQLKEQGYRVGYMGKWHAGLGETANSVGFEGYGPRHYGNVREYEGYHRYLEQHNLEMPEPVIEFYAQSEENWMDSSGYVKGDTDATPGHFLAHQTIEMLTGFSQGDAPFFVTCNFWGPHAPYWPSDEYKDRYNPADIPPWPGFDEDRADTPMAHRRFRHSVMGPAGQADWAVWSQMVARYYAQTTMLDAALGKIITAMKEQGIYDDALIIFTADHGDSAGIHGGTFDKGAMAYEEIYHTPLIVKMPGQAEAGTTRDHFVSLLDVTATICDAAETSLPQCDGESLLSIIANSSHAWRDDLYAQFHGHRFPVAQRILWWRNFKYVLNFADKDELYDLDDDPHELRNLIAEPAHAETLAEMQHRMLANMQNSADTLGPQSWTIFTRPMKF